jgi:hypothetical protein
MLRHRLSARFNTIGHGGNNRRRQTAAERLGQLIEST